MYLSLSSHSASQKLARKSSVLSILLLKIWVGLSECILKGKNLLQSEARTLRPLGPQSRTLPMLRHHCFTVNLAHLPLKLTL